MPILNVNWLEGRTAEQKRELAKRFTDALTQVTGCPAEAVTVIFSDHPRTDIAKAGKLYSD
jgi:4-oxalocrotonate tautomerase